MVLHVCLSVQTQSMLTIVLPGLPYLICVRVWCGEREIQSMMQNNRNN